MKQAIIATVVAMLAAYGVNAYASGLSEITGINIDFNRGTVSIKPPNIGAVPGVLRNLPKDVAQAALNPVAPVLATAIRLSRGQALNRGVQSMPSNIRNQLQPYFPPQILDRARWTTAGGISIDGALKNWLNQEGAVVFDEVIVFSSVQSANNDVALWAHELTHVLQYAQLGVETFAFYYSVNSNQFEGEARDNSNRIVASINATRQGQPRSWAYEGQLASPSQQVSWASMNQSARQAIQPSQCIWINNFNNTTGNSCPVRVTVTDAIVRRLADGYTFTIPCDQPTCTYPPFQAGPLLSPPGHLIIGNNTAYAQ